MNNISSEFIAQSVLHIEENLPRIQKCLGELTEEELWQRPNSSSNSIGNLVLHLCGNITQYIISGLGKENDNRNRDSEFSVSGGYTKAQLEEKITNTITKAVQVIKNLKEEELTQTISVQGYKPSGISILVH